MSGGGLISADLAQYKSTLQYNSGQYATVTHYRYTPFSTHFQIEISFLMGFLNQHFHLHNNQKS